jgi:hypothetical protein
MVHWHGFHQALARWLYPDGLPDPSAPLEAARLAERWLAEHPE